MDAAEPDTAWAWQAWIGPAEIAASAKAETDADPRAGAHHPIHGQPPAPAADDAQARWAVLARANNPIPPPPGCRPLTAEEIAAWLGVAS